MKLLLENWRKYLNEGIDPRIQKQIDNLLQIPGVGIRLKFPAGGARIEYVQLDEAADEEATVDVDDQDTRMSMAARILNPSSAAWARADMKRAGLPAGSVSILKATPKQDGSCLDGYIVYMAEATTGWGPLLYEVALEWASQNGGGLTPDRGLVSPDAARVWEKYVKRPGVDKKQMDVDHNLDGGWMKDIPQLTPDVYADDCDQGAAIDAAGEDDWMKTPLSKMYYKGTPEVMKILEDAGRLII